MRRLLILVLVAISSPFASAQEPVYAIYGAKAQGSLGTVTSVNVGILPSGKQAECLRQIEVFETAVSRSKSAAGPELIPSKCVASLPENLQPMVFGLPLVDAYVVKQSGDWAPIYTAWYGLSGTDPTSMCERLISGMRATLKPGQVNVTCLAPKSVRKKS